MIHLEIYATRGLLPPPPVRGVCLLVEVALTVSWLVTWGQVALPTLVKLGTPVRLLPIWLRVFEPCDSSSA